MSAVAVACVLSASCALIPAVRAAGMVARRYAMARHPAPTFLFVDMVGYTAFAECNGDEQAAHIAREFRRTVSTLSREHGGRYVKSMGDGAMIWIPDAGRAVALASRVLAEVGSCAGLLPVRVGAHTGPALMRGWDWFGRTVNVAARLADEAAPNEALISGVTRSAARSGVDSVLSGSSEVLLRGIQRPVSVWRISGRDVSHVTAVCLAGEVTGIAGRIAATVTS